MSQCRDFYTPPSIAKHKKLRYRFQQYDINCHLQQKKEFHDLFWNKKELNVQEASQIKQKQFLSLHIKNKNHERTNSLLHSFRYKQSKKKLTLVRSNRFRIRSCVCSHCGHNSTFQQINHDVPLVLEQKKKINTQVSFNNGPPSSRHILDESQDKKYTDVQEIRILTPTPIENNNRKKYFVKQKKVRSIHESMSKVPVSNFQDEKYRHIQRSENFNKSFEPLKRFLQSPSQMQTLPLIKINLTQNETLRKPVSLNVSILRVNQKFISPSMSQIITPLQTTKLFSPGKKACKTQTRNRQLQKFKEYLQR